MKTFSSLFEKADNEIMSVTSKDTGEQLPVRKKLKLNPKPMMKPQAPPEDDDVEWIDDTLDPSERRIAYPNQYTREIDLPDYKQDKNQESPNDVNFGADLDDYISNVLPDHRDGHRDFLKFARDYSDRLGFHPAYKSKEFDTYERARHALHVQQGAYSRLNVKGGAPYKQASKLGLKYKGFGYWADPETGEVTHKTVGDQLVTTKDDKPVEITQTSDANRTAEKLKLARLQKEYEDARQALTDVGLETSDDLYSWTNQNKLRLFFNKYLGYLKDHGNADLDDLLKLTGDDKDVIEGIFDMGDFDMKGYQARLKDMGIDMPGIKEKLRDDYGLEPDAITDRVGKLLQVLGSSQLFNREFEEEVDDLKELLTHMHDGESDVISALAYPDFEEFRSTFYEDERQNTDQTYNRRDLRTGEPITETSAKRMTRLMGLLENPEQYKRLLDWLQEDAYTFKQLMSELPDNMPLMDIDEIETLVSAIHDNYNSDMEYLDDDARSPGTALRNVYNHVIREYTDGPGWANSQGPFDEYNQSDVHAWYAQMLSDGIRAANRGGAQTPYDDEPIYRALRGSYARDLYDEMEPGDEFTDDQFASFSEDEVLHSFVSPGDTTVMQVNNPRYGAKISEISHHPHEREVLLDRGQRYRVLDKNRGGIYNRLILEQLDD